MLVFGDHAADVEVRAQLTRLRERLVEAAEQPQDGLHESLTWLLLVSGELWQGLADWEWRERGKRDARTPLQALCGGFTRDVAQALWRAFEERPVTLPSPAALTELSRLELPRTVRVKLPEGFAFYALYPELYAAAAARWREALAPALASQVRVVGLRSIGTALSAMVSAGLETEDVPWTVRPQGHPFRRELVLDVTDEKSLTGTVAVVDEGPGLSGSSFSSVGACIEARGGSPHFFPAHGNALGPEASPQVRERWARTPRHVVSFEALIQPRMRKWMEPLTGPIVHMEDVSGGAWRRHVYRDEAQWPGTLGWQERRKYLLTTASGHTFLAKFAGVGPYSDPHERLGERLSSEGLIPAFVGRRHGFILHRWQPGVPLNAADGAPSTAECMEQVAHYLAQRVRLLSSEQGNGASPESLRQMAEHNIRLLLGEEASQEVARFSLPEAWAPFPTDNRLMPFEWLVHEGRLFKTDALDHHRAHDLIGSQDVAWDVAGACLELFWSKSGDAAAAFVDCFEAASGARVNRETLAFASLCYAAFRAGQVSFAKDACGGPGPERERLTWALEGYRLRLEHCLTHPP